MSLVRCLPRLVAEGRLTAEQAERAEAIYGRRVRHHRRSMGSAAAEALASEEAARAMEIEALRRRRQALLQVDAQRRVVTDMASYKGDRPGSAAIALLVRDERAPYSNFEYRWRAVRGEAHSLLDGLLLHHRRNLLGEVRHKADLDDLARERFGHDTGNLSAKEFAAAFGEAAEMLRQRFNAAGGHIGKLEGWGLPQSHDAVAISEAGFEAWAGGARTWFDRGRMVDHDTGLPMDDDAFEALLKDLYATVSSDGWADRVPGAHGGRKLANMRAEHRVIFFRDADAWLAYQAKYGRGNAFDAMMNHIDGMSRDIALMEILGPNPAATVEWLKQALTKQGQLDGGRSPRRLFRLIPGRLRIDQARMDGNVIQQVYDEAIGKTREPHSRGVALTFSALRSWQVATKLGSAVLSTTSDQATQALTRRFNGLPVARAALTQVKMLNPLDAGDRAFAIRSHLIAEEASQIASAQARYTGEELTGEISRRMAEGVLRLSGLSAVTQGGRWAFGMDFLSALTDHSVKGWDQLDPPFRRMWQRHGIGEAEWDRLRSTPLEEERGAHWLHPRNIEDQALRTRLMEIIHTEMDFAVPVPGLRMRASIHARAKKGTLLGELLRTGFQFKSFPVTVMLMQGQRILAQQGWNAARYAASMSILMTAAGAVAVWMKDLSKGRDPREADGEFLLEAFAQGGGAGIYGDFLRSSRNRFGTGFEATLKGPAWQTLGAAESLTIDPLLVGLIDGEDPQLGKRAVKAARSETPGGSLWWARAGFERVMLDTMQEWTDPDAADTFRRIERRAEKDYGQGFWWEPGDSEPERAPDWGNVLPEE